MKSFYFLSFLFLFSALHAISQPSVQWQKCYGGWGDEDAYSSAICPDGGFILCGYTTTTGTNGDVTGNHGGDDGWLVRTDSNGVILWKKCYGGTNNEELHSVITTVDGGFAFLGTTKSNNGDVSNNHDASGSTSDFWFAKLNSNGSIAWKKCYGGTANDYGYCVIQTSDHGYLLGGHSYSNDGDASNNHGGDDYWVVKIDSVGTLQWQKCLGGTSQEWGYRVREVPSGGYLVFGISSSNNGNVSGTHGGEEYWAALLDINGNISDNNCFGGSAWDDGLNMIPTSDGGFAMIGIAASTNGNVTGNHGTDLWLVKTDAGLNLQWQKCLGGSGTERGFDIKETSDGGYLIAGYTTTNNDGDVSGYHGNIDIWLVKVNYAGSLLWQKCLGGSQPENSFEFQDILHQKPDGSIFIFVNTESNDGDVSGNHQISSNDFWLVKLMDNSNKISGTLYYDSNNNQIFDAGENACGNKLVSSSSGSIGFTNQNGAYALSIADSGNYTATPQSILYHTPTPTSQSAYFPLQTNMNDAGNDFAFAPNGTFNDMKVNIFAITGTRRSFPAQYLISYENVGTTTQSGQIIWTTGNYILSYISSSLTPSFSSADSVVWNYSNVAPSQSGYFILTVQVTALCNVGDTIHSIAQILPVAGDANPADNYLDWKSTVLSACDPNEIVVDQNTLTNFEIADEPYLTYNIRFQNTGNDSAVNIIIRDTLPSELQPMSIEFLSATDSVQLSFDQASNELTFTFNNIMLPDSNVNEPASHGGVSYRIKPLSTLSVGTTINNQVAIYFDANAPVLTNTAQTLIIDGCTLVQTQIQNDTLSICAGDSILIGGSWISVAGNYTDIYPDIHSCDSLIVNSNVSIETIDNTVTTTGNLMSAPAGAFTYQWYSCNPLTAINGEISQIFTPTVNGDYAVEITNANSCSVMSNCIFMNVNGTVQISSGQNISTYPNPANDQLTIKNGQLTINGIEITDVLGRIVADPKPLRLSTNNSEGVLTPNTELTIDVRELSEGIYFLSLVSENNFTYKIPVVISR